MIAKREKNENEKGFYMIGPCHRGNVSIHIYEGPRALSLNMLRRREISRN
jgi:hypothetical protein